MITGKKYQIGENSRHFLHVSELFPKFTSTLLGMLRKWNLEQMKTSDSSYETNKKCTQTNQTKEPSGGKCAQKKINFFERHKREKKALSKSNPCHIFLPKMRKNVNNFSVMRVIVVEKKYRTLVDTIKR